MTRRFLEFALLIETLLASGCLSAHTFRKDTTTPKMPAPLAETPNPTTKSPEIVPASAAQPAESLPKNSLKANAATAHANRSQFYVPPAPIPPGLPALPREIEPVASSMPPIESAPKHPIARALDCILDNRHDEALQHLQNYDANTQTLLLRMLPMFSLVAKKSNLSSADIAALNVQMSGVMEFLQQKSEFEISKMCFCESIKEFAIYKELPTGHEFPATAPPDRVGEYIYLYVAFKNFASQRNQDKYEIAIASRVDILNDKSEIVGPLIRPAKEAIVIQKSLGEYYTKFGFYLPQLDPGAYSLAVELADETIPGAGRTVRRTIPFRVAAFPP